MTNGVENPMEIAVHQTFNNVRVNKYVYLAQEIKMGKENQLYAINRRKVQLTYTYDVGSIHKAAVCF